MNVTNLGRRAGLNALCSLLLLLPVGQAVAGVIYDNGPANRQNAVQSDVRRGEQLADDFRLQFPELTIGTIAWTGMYFDPSTGTFPGSPSDDDFTIDIFEDNGLGQPQDLPLQTVIPLGALSRVADGTLDPNILPVPLYSYSQDIEPITLLNDTTYWVSITNNTNTNFTGNIQWYWATADALPPPNNAVNAQVRTINTVPPGIWGPAPSNVELAFNLSGPPVVPTPGTLLLLAPALLWLGRMRRRR